MNTNRPQVGVTSLVIKDRAVLLVKRGNHPYKGEWSLPGGHLEFGEQLEGAVVRETKEETGIDIRISRFLKFENVIIREAKRDFQLIIFHFEGILANGILTSGSDAVDARWMNISDFSDYQITPIAVDIIREFGNILPERK